jgi:hypothetical protein
LSDSEFPGSAGASLIADLQVAFEAALSVLKASQKTGTPSPVVREIFGKGLGPFEQSTHIESVTELEGAHFDDYVSTLERSINISPALQKTFHQFFATAKQPKSNNWQMFRAIYSTNDRGDCQYVNILSQKLTNGDYNFYYALIDTNF